jgi:hypothetical protein
MSGAREDEVRNLMAALNYWEHNYGTAYAPDAQLKSTG